MSGVVAVVRATLLLVKHRGQRGPLLVGQYEDRSEESDV